MMGTTGWPGKIALGLALLGGLIGVANAALAVSQVGSLPDYSSRLGFGWLALAMAGLAAASGLLVRTRPIVAGVLMTVGALVGAVAINLFYINTYYLLAVPLWLVGAVFALVEAGTARMRRAHPSQ